VRKRIGASIAVLALAVAGCGVVPHKAYDGPSRPASQLSVLKAGAYGQELSPVSVVDLRTIDGAAQRGGMYLASVLPGRHAVGLSEELRAGTRTRTQFCIVELETTAGCVYAPRPPSPPTDVIIGRTTEWEWSVDMPVAIDCADGSGFQIRAPARCGASAKLLERPRP
jgi:hypothetical protein